MKSADELLKEDFSLSEWKELPIELKKDERVLQKAVEKINELELEKMKDICYSNAFIIKYLSQKNQMAIADSSTFKYIDEDLQFKALNREPKMIHLAAKKVQVKYVMSKPLAMSKFSLDLQKNVTTVNPNYLEFASVDVQVDLAAENNNLLAYCSNMVQCMYLKKNPNYYNKCNYEVRRNIVTLKNLNPELISIKTLDAYLSDHSDNLSVDEMNEYKDKLAKTERKDRRELVNYMDYLIANINKKRL